MIDQVKFMSYVFDIEWTPGYSKKFMENTGNLNGFISYVDNIIRIDSERADRVQILIHEVTHLIATTFSVDLNESEVSRMSEGFYHFMEANGFMGES